MSTPDALALSRAATAIPLLLLTANVRRADPLYLLGFALLAFAMWSDAVDGHIARRAGTATPLGAFLDAAADKLVVFAVVLPLAHPPFMAPYLAALVAREIAVTALRWLAAARGIDVRATALAKAKTAALYASAASFLLAFGLWASPLIQLGELLLGAGTLLAIASLPPYVLALRRTRA